VEWSTGRIGIAMEGSCIYLQVNVPGRKYGPGGSLLIPGKLRSQTRVRRQAGILTHLDPPMLKSITDEKKCFRWIA